MKQSPNASPPRNSNTNHPPLARNAQGHLIAMPEGAMSWSIKRDTRGRPKVIKGPDGHPYRLGLTATEQDIADNFGPGTYRLDALDALGNVLDYVTTIEVTGDESDDDQNDEDDGASTTSGARGASTDLRFALHTIMQMSRAQSESLRAVSEAQADWVKGLANAKALPRNAVYVGPPALPEPDELDDESDDESDDDGDDGERNAQPTAAPTPPWMVALQSAIGPAVDVLMSKVMPRNAAPAAQPPAAPPPEPQAAASQAPRPPPPPATPNPMIHLAEINEGLSDAERTILGNALRGRDAETLTAELLKLSVADAITIVSARIAELGVEREHARARAARTRDETARDATRREAATPETDATEPAVPMTTDGPLPTADATAPDFMRHVLAVAAFLDSDQRVAVLALIQRLPPDRVEQLKSTLLAMHAEAAAAWIRENLATLSAEAAS